METVLRIANAQPLPNEFWGNNAVYMGYCTMPDDYGRAYTPALCEKEFALVQRAGIRIARTFYNYNFAWEAEKGCFDFENERMQGFYTWLGRMQEMGVEVILSLGWWFPQDVFGGSNRLCPGAVENDEEASIANYTQWAADSLQHILVEHGFDNVKYITLFTEPQCENGGYTTLEARYEGWLTCVKALDDKLRAAGLRDRVLFMGPNEGSTATSDMVRWAAEHASAYIDVYSSHNYMHEEMPEIGTAFTHGRALVMGIMGSRIHQRVALRKNTEYTLTVRMMLRGADLNTVSGHVLLGAFYQAEGYNRYSFTAGSQETTRLHRRSTEMIDAAHLEEELTEYRFTFNSRDFEEALIGLFCDVKTPGAVLYVDSLSMQDADGVEQLRDSGFASNTDWHTLSCAICCSHAYYDWELWAKTGLSYVPEGKPYIFDEYNEFELGRDNPVHGTAMSLAKVAFMNSGATSSLIWTLFDQQWPSQRNTGNGNGFEDGVLKHGIVPVLTSDNAPYPSFEAFAITSRFFGGKGTKVWKGEGVGNLQCTAVQLPDGDVSVLVVNYNEEERDFVLSFEQPVGKTLHRFLYDPSTVQGGVPIEADRDLTVEREFRDRLPANGVAVYTTYPA